MSLIYNFPLKMHVGAPCKAIVNVDELIKRGQCIAVPEGLGAKIHSSVTGKVKDFNDKFILIEADKEQSEDYVKIKDCETLKDICFEAGIVGAGGAGFPTHIKVGTELKAGYIIANCVECEPVLCHNITMIEQNPELVVKGIKYAMEATKATHGVIGIKEKNQNAIKALEKILPNYKDITIKTLPNLYPMGEERALIHEIFDKWLEPTQLPIEANCVILNAETLANIVRAVEDKKPVIDKDVTVGGKLVNGKKQNVFFNTPIGTPVKEMIEKCGGIDGEYGEVIIGGPYTGSAGNIEEGVVTKTTGGIIVTIPFPKYEGKLGLLVCACGANEDRLRDIASKMGSEVVAAVPCKNVEVIKGANKCKTPGT
ncbi:proline reductase-associated electron transfer protein PrdC [Sedimentibacter sp. zth1]|nr:proline reductase-associated electron transfer protein PrdC [Sedimentibacter sp. zth1]